MKKRIAAGVLCALLLALSASALDGFDPVSVSSRTEPTMMAGPRPIAVIIRVTNVADGVLPGPVRLFDPAGERVGEYAELEPGAAVEYQGGWEVTEEELTKGKISYKLTYPVEVDGVTQSLTRLVPVPLRRERFRIGLALQVSPESASPGQIVSVRYTLVNAGVLPAEAVRIQNPDLNQEIELAALNPGEQAVVLRSFVMGNRATAIIKARAQYREAGSERIFTSISDPLPAVGPAAHGLVLNLEAPGDPAFQPGVPMALRCTLANRGTAAYTGIVIAEETLGEVLRLEALPAGARLDYAWEAEGPKPQELRLRMTARNPEGAEVEIASNVLAVEEEGY